jgi:integrase
MGEYTTRALSKEQYIEIIETIQNGFLNSRPNKQVATCLVLEANLGIRIGDILNLKLNSIIKDSEGYRLNIIEQKTEKKRTFTVPTELYNYIQQYCIDNNKKSNEKIFDITTRQVQRILKKAVDYLGYEEISTHSFRKFYATQIYINNNYNIMLVKTLLQHQSINTTQNYIPIASKEIEEAIKNNLNLL